MRPTPRGIYIALSGAVFALLPVLVSPRLWTFWPIFAAWLALAFGFDAILSPRRDLMRCELSSPLRLYIGESDLARLIVHIPGGTSLRLQMTADLSEHLAEQPSRTAVASLGKCVFELPLVPGRRGVSRIEAVWLRYHGPLGLLASTVRVALDREIPVLPNILPVQRAALRFVGSRETRAGLKIERFRGDGTEFDSIKEFVPGDDNRAIDWKVSARHHKLFARQFRAERNHQVVLVVDSGHLMAEPLAGIPKLDHALNVALLLSYVCLQSGDRVGFFSFDAQIGPFIEPQGGMRVHRAMTQMTSRVRYSEAETNFTLGLTTLAQRVRRRSLIIVLTDFVDTITAELMLENLGRLSGRHLVLFVALRDPELARVEAAPPASTTSLNRAVVAHSFVQDRGVVLKRLRRMGIHSIDAEPARIGADLVNHYLEIKRREMI